MSAEDKFNSIVSEFKAEVEKSVTVALESIHSEMVPYLNDDTEFNAIYRARDIVKNIIDGRFDVEDGEIVCGFFSTKLTSNDYDRLVDSLAARLSDKAKDLKIERLERQIKELLK